MSTPPDPPAIRPLYEEHGATEYYRAHGATYRNPHEPIVRALIQQAAHDFPFNRSAGVLDLAAGSGEATLALRELGCTSIDALDPFTGQAYSERTGQHCESISFEEVARGVLASRRYELCVCSFALHLAPNSVLPNLCFQLALICKTLWVLTPHKRPHLKEEWGFKMRNEILLSRVRLRVYDSSLARNK
jgi:hypothetical protein